MCRENYVPLLSRHSEVIKFEVNKVFEDISLVGVGNAIREVALPHGVWDIAVYSSDRWISSLLTPWSIRGMALVAVIFLLLTVWQFRNLRKQQRLDADRLKTAIDTMPDGFVLYDEYDRLVICNEKYKDFYTKSAPAMMPGTSFEAILKYVLSNGQYAEALGREQEWLEQRLEDHRKDNAFVEQELDDGRWLRIIERATPDGSRVGLRVDITDLKRNEKKLEMLLNRNPAIVMSQGGDWKIQTCSDAWARQFWVSQGGNNRARHNRLYANRRCPGK
ncbi:MAG: PAS-domain containing protein [Spongiibacteraceae bacterium]